VGGSELFWHRRLARFYRVTFVKGIIVMKLSRLATSLLFTGALLVLPLKVQANTVFAPGGLLGPGVTTIFVGTNSGDPTQGFTAKVVSQVYAPGSGAYAGNFTDGAVTASDFIYAYLITDMIEAPSTGFIDFFSAKSGSTIDAVGYDHSAGGVDPSSSSRINPVGFASSASWNFLSPVISLTNPNSTVLLFASAGAPVFQPGSLSDGASASSLIVSATGPNLIGQPLPLPTAAFAGAGLLGVLSMGRRRRMKTA